MFHFFQNKTVNSNTLQESSKAILEVFTVTVDRLNNVVAQAKTQIEIKTEEIKKAEVERTALNNIVEQNEQIIVKINGLLN